MIPLTQTNDTPNRVYFPGARVTPQTDDEINEWCSRLGTNRGRVLDALVLHALATKFPRAQKPLVKNQNSKTK